MHRGLLALASLQSVPTFLVDNYVAFNCLLWPTLLDIVKAKKISQQKLGKMHGTSIIVPCVRWNCSSVYCISYKVSTIKFRHQKQCFFPADPLQIDEPFVRLQTSYISPMSHIWWAISQISASIKHASYQKWRAKNKNHYHVNLIGPTCAIKSFDETGLRFSIKTSLCL